MKTLLLTTAMLVLALLVPPQASAALPRLGLIDVGGMFYVDDEGAVDGNGVWIWEESNGQLGLQRGGCSPFVPNDCWTCDSYAECAADPDTLIL